MLLECKADHFPFKAHYDYRVQMTKVQISDFVLYLGFESQLDPIFLLHAQYYNYFSLLGNHYNYQGAALISPLLMTGGGSTRMRASSVLGGRGGGMSPSSSSS